jgi:ubiquitin carboxyl-terminal hydrolase L5
MNKQDQIDIGPELSNLAQFSTGLPARAKGYSIGNCEKIRVAHNSFTRQDPFFTEEESKPATDDDDVFHFISFVPFNGMLYELDGLQPGPICYG